MWKRLFSGVLAMVLLLIALPSIEIKTHGAYYPEGWKDWRQFDEPWGNELMSPGYETIGKVGCWVSSYAKAYIQAGLIDDSDKDFDIGKFVKWCGDNGVLNSNCWIIDFDKICRYPDGKTLKFDTAPGDSDPGRYSTYGWTEEQLVDKFTELRNQGHLLIVRVRGYSHSILVGDPFINENGQKDVELYDTGWSDGCLAIRSHNHKLFYDGRIHIDNYTLLTRSDGQPVYPGTMYDNNSTAEETLKKDSENISEDNSPLYRLSRYNEQQKESLALLKNKTMDNYEVSAWKWNMILSQFAIPYVDSLHDVMSDENILSLYKSVQNVTWEENAYLKKGADQCNEDFKNGAKEYIEYLKKNSDKLNEVLRLLYTESNNVYTPLLNDNKTSATVSDLYYGEVLYLLDNVTLTGDTIKEYSIDNSDTGEDADNSTVDNQSQNNPILQQISTKKNQSIESKISMWDSMEKMYELCNKDARSTYKSILDNSIVQSITVPVYTSTDATALYNTLFVSNAMQMLGDVYGNQSTTETFVNDYKDKALFMDRWGNICINEGSKYIIIYPAYANPLLVSTELDDEDIAGVYYEALSEQMSRYNLDISGDGKQTYLLTNDDAVEITMSDAIKHIKDYNVANKSDYLGYLSKSYRQTSLLNNKGNDVSELVYNRMLSNVLVDDANPPLARFDTTTFPYGSKLIMTMMTRNTKTTTGKNWYAELKSPYFDKLKEDVPLADLIFGKDSLDGKLTAERFGVRVGWKDTKRGTGAIGVAIDNGISVLEASGNIVMLSEYKEKGNVLNSSFGNNIQSLESSGALLGYSTNDVLNSTMEYPFMTYFNGIKGVWDIENRNTLLGFLTQYGYLNPTFRYRSTFDTDKEFTPLTPSRYESNYTLEYLDSERFNIYFTTNTDMLTKISYIDGETVLNKSTTRAIDDSYLNTLINGKMSAQYTKPLTDSNARRVRFMSIPLLSYTVDDTSSWGIWNGQSGTIDRLRDTDLMLSLNEGILSAEQQKTENIIGSNSHSTGLKYLLTNQIVSNVITNYPIEDIISIAYMWDTYYIPNSPICTKLDVKGLGVEESIYDVNTVVTPYNGMSEDNVNKLFYTKETNNSINMQFNTVLDNSTPKTSTCTINRDVYVVQVHFPTMLLAINKNGSGDNLDRWVKELEDSASTSTYIMDLISTFMKHPLIGLVNLFIGLLQACHSYISKGTIGSLFNIQLLFNSVIRSNLLFYFIIIYTVSMCVGLLIISIKYFYQRQSNGLTKMIGRAVALGIIPILLIGATGFLFEFVTNIMMRPLLSKVVLTELEGDKRSGSKIQLSTKESILLDNTPYDQETLADLSVEFLIGFDKYNNPIYKNVSLSDLYTTVSVEDWSGTAEYLDDKESFVGFNQTESAFWYNTEEFIPVHYDKYNISVFYYFYDLIKSNYLCYHKLKGSDMLTGFNKTDIGSDNTSYKNTIKTAEESYETFTGGVLSMFTDESFYLVNNGYSDMFGLSNLFNMTDSTTGFPLESYSKNQIITDWASIEYEKECQALKDGNIKSLNVSPIAGLINSEYWKYYSKSSFIKDNSIERGNTMGCYMFTPDYIQNFASDYDEFSNTFDFSDGWYNGDCVLKSAENERIPWRVYGSETLFTRDTTNEYKELAHSTKLELTLFQLNKELYQQALTLLNTYDESNITDDTMIFTIALMTTFKFNEVFNAPTKSIDTGDISTDKIFRAVYANDIENVIDTPNLIYMIFQKSNLIACVFFFIAEAIFVLTLFIRCILYSLLIIATVVCCLSSVLISEKIFNKALKGIILQLLLLLFGQIIILLVLRLGAIILPSVDSGAFIVVLTLVFIVICIALLLWHLAMLRSLISDMRTFGYAMFKEKLNGFTSIVSIAMLKINNFRAHKVYGSGTVNSIDRVVEEKDLFKFIHKRRSYNSQRVETDDEDADKDK